MRLPASILARPSVVGDYHSYMDGFHRGPIMCPRKGLPCFLLSFLPLSLSSGVGHLQVLITVFHTHTHWSSHNMLPFVPLLILPIAYLPFVLGQDSPTCYWPNGKSADNKTTPCNTSAESSHCCGPDDACLSNGYCLQTRGVFANRLGRAACTDPSLPSLYCASYCTDCTRSDPTKRELIEAADGS